MPSIYSPAAVILGDITLPSDGDAKSAASVNTPLEALADGVEYLNSLAIPRVDTFNASDKALVKAQWCALGEAFHEALVAPRGDVQSPFQRTCAPAQGQP